MRMPTGPYSTNISRSDRNVASTCTMSEIKNATYHKKHLIRKKQYQQQNMDSSAFTYQHNKNTCITKVEPM